MNARLALMGQTVGERIREARLRKKMTRAELGRYALQLDGSGPVVDNHAEHMVGLWETDTYNPTISYCRRIAEALDVSPCFLAFGRVLRTDTVRARAAA